MLDFQKFKCVMLKMTHVDCVELILKRMASRLNYNFRFTLNKNYGDFFLI